MTVNFESLDAATSARNALNGREFLGADIGPIRVGYARAPSSGQHGQDGSPSPNNFPSVFQSQRSEDPATHRPAGTAPMTQENVSHIESYGNDLVRDLINKGSPNPNRDVAPPAQTPPPHPPADVAAEGDVNEQQMLMTVLSHGDANLAADVQAVGSESDEIILSRVITDAPIP
jgi:protein JSN1